MGLFDWLLQVAIQTAVTAATIWLIKETVTYLVTKTNLPQAIRRFVAGHKRDDKRLESATKVMVKENTVHEVCFTIFDDYNTNLGDGNIASDVGISNDIRSGDVIIL